MRAAIIHAPGDVRCEEVPDPVIQEPGDVVIRLLASCVCGSDLWPYRGLSKLPFPAPIGHEYVGVVEQAGADVATVRVGDTVVGSFFASDGTCAMCQAGWPSLCLNVVAMGELGAQAELLRVPLADGTLVVVPGPVDADLIPSLLAVSDVFSTGWFGADAAESGPDKTVAVVGDGAVGLSAVLAAHTMGAERIIAMSRHPERQALARRFGATDVVEERGDDGIQKVKALTDGLGADSVVEAVGTQEAMLQAIGACRGAGHVGFVGVSHGVELTGSMLFRRQIHLFGGPAPARRYLPDLIGRVMRRELEPGLVFDGEWDLADVADAYRAMHERRTIKALLRV